MIARHVVIDPVAKVVSAARRVETELFDAIEPRVQLKVLAEHVDFGAAIIAVIDAWI